MDTTQGRLMAAVANLIKAKGRFHTEQNYAALVAAYDAAIAAQVPPVATVQDEQLVMLRKLAKAATPGPWYVDDIKNEGDYGSGPDTQSGFRSYAVCDENKGEALFDTLNSDACTVEVDEDGAWDRVGQKNAEFIAAANPAVVLGLLDQLEQARAAQSAPGAGAVLTDNDTPLEDDQVEFLASICDAYESGIGHGLQQDGHSDAPYTSRTCRVAYTAGYDEGLERAHAAGQAPIAAQEPVAWEVEQYSPSMSSTDGYWVKEVVKRNPAGWDGFRNPRPLVYGDTAPAAPQAGSELPALKQFSPSCSNGVAGMMEHPHGSYVLLKDATLAAARQAPQPQQPMTMSYVQDVPDQCDRIVWRGAYYHLRQNVAPQAVAAPDRDAVLVEALIECEAIRNSGCEARVGAAECCEAIGQLRALKSPASPQPSAAPADKRLPSMSMFATMGDYKAARDEFDNGAAPDPCPQCIPGAVCKTPTCGRLAKVTPDDSKDTK